jgi:hypothetical protein
MPKDDTVAAADLAWTREKLRLAQKALADQRAENKRLRERLDYVERMLAMRQRLSTVFVFRH